MNTEKKRNGGEDRQLSCLVDTPVGTIRIVEDGQGICALEFVEAGGSVVEPERAGRFLNEAKRQLLAYFAGERRAFDLPLSTHGSAFQERVWAVLRSIPYGETRSYQQVAELAGSSRAVRAVGMANHRNPIPILIPCHRVVGKDGKLVGYAGGLARKRILLEMECRH